MGGQATRPGARVRSYAERKGFMLRSVSGNMMCLPILLLIQLLCENRCAKRGACEDTAPQAAV
jgi:hypothetical protein